MPGGYKSDHSEFIVVITTARADFVLETSLLLYSNSAFNATVFRHKDSFIYTEKGVRSY